MTVNCNKPRIITSIIKTIIIIKTNQVIVFPKPILKISAKTSLKFKALLILSYLASLANEKLYKTNCGDIHYWIHTIDETAPTIVFLPGLTADHHLFDKQIDYFKEL